MPTASPGLRLMTPEQFVRHIHSQFGVDLSKPYKGATSALQRYRLPLGGLDHDTVYERDRQMKVQTLLAAQALAWEAAERVTERQRPRNLSTPDEAGWTPRLQDYFLRINSRPATLEEVQFFEQKARLLMENNAKPEQVWTALVYVMLAAVEFWSL